MDSQVLSLKKELKCWESMFNRKYGRKPNKTDIDESSPEIRESYKRYARLKSGNVSLPSVEQDTTETAANNHDVFGASLNKSKTKPSLNTIITSFDSEDVWTPPKLKGKLHKPLNKSLKKKKENNEFKENIEFKENEVVNGDEKENCGSSEIMSFQISNERSKGKVNTIKSGSLRRSSMIRKSIGRFANMSQDILDDCQTGVKNRTTNLSNEISTNNKVAENPEGQQNKVVLESPTAVSHINTDTGEQVVNRTLQNKYNEEEISFKGDVIDKTSVIPDNSNYSDILVSKITMNRSDETTARLVVNNAGVSNSSGVPEGNVVDSMTPVSPQCVENKIKTKGKRKRKPDNKGDDEIPDKCKKVKLNKKSASKVKRLVSDNFVKIDLRKKTYQRGVSKLTGGSYKRKMWKQKTSFELASKTGWKGGNKKVCFRCGGEGHWAKFCKGPAKKVDPFSKLEEEKNSIEFQHLNENQSSCFDHLDGVESSNSFATTKKFTIDDVLDIEPCWPRQPYTISSSSSEGNDLLFQPNGAVPSQDAYDNVLKNLKTFGFTSFREGQHDAVARIVSGLSTLLVLATGSGKSLCYQLPAYLYFKEKKRMTIVVSPLVALMQDQVANLPSCLPGAFLNSSMTKLQQQRVIKKIKDGLIAILLVSPEALVSGGFGTGILPPKSSLPPLAFACVDEAHCLSEWSHNFRPSYLKVCKVLREKYNISCLLGLTATASQTTAKSVVHHLGIPSHSGSIIRDPNPIPENLQITSSRDENRDQALVELLQNKPFLECDSIIVYVTRRTEADRLAVLLRTCLPEREAKAKDATQQVIEKKKTKAKTTKKEKPFWWTSEAYHAGLTPAQRRRIQTQFMSSELRIVVATVAFGMGLDKSDVRSVVHYNMPKSFENYVQEIGRAGRDGKPSYCHVFIDEETSDLNELRRHIYGNSIDRSTVKKFVEYVFPSCDCRKLNENHLSVEMKKLGQVHNNEQYQEELSDSELELYFTKGADESMLLDIGEEVISPNNLIDVNLDASKSLDRDMQSECQTSNDTPGELNRCPVEIKDPLPVQQVTGVQMDPNGSVTNERSAHNNRDEEYCSGHRFSLSIDSLVTSLDMPEENIATLMSYLELHEKNYIQILNPIRSECTVKCYGGPEQFQLLARKFPPVALAIRKLREDEVRYLYSMRQIDLNLCEIADLMCWDVLTVAREVRSLQWNMAYALDAPLNKTGKSGIIVESEKLSFHGTTAEMIKDNDVDEICDFIYGNVVKQEETRLLQLDALYNVLKEVSCKEYWQLPLNERVDSHARDCISQYFLCDEEGQYKLLKEICKEDTKIEIPSRRWNMIAGDIRNVLISHPDQDFTGRAVARIFQGISSPCYPAIIFGRDRRFWRQYLDVDFNELRIFATKQIRQLRS